MVANPISSVSLNGLKLWQLKYSAFLLGQTTTGTRKVVEDVIRQRLASPSLADKKTTRVVSVDMGIRNLAFCVLEASHVPTMVKDDAKSIATDIRIQAWEKIDLLHTLSRSHRTAEGVDPSSRDGAKDILKSSFTPSVMCKTAYDVTQVLLKHNPDAILIERQRFRSGGAAAIQEWTIRVNMLESMLWACLRTLRESDTPGSFPTVHEVSPARVANFWLAGSAPLKVALRPSRDIFVGADQQDKQAVQLARGKVEKKDKIAIVKAWIDEREDHERSGEVALQFDGEAAKMAELFRANGKQRRSSPSGAEAEQRFGKLDDLADCLLQGAAWVRWEENRRLMVDVLEPWDIPKVRL